MKKKKKKNPNQKTRSHFSFFCFVIRFANVQAEVCAMLLCYLSSTPHQQFLAIPFILTFFFFCFSMYRRRLIVHRCTFIHAHTHPPTHPPTRRPSLPPILNFISCFFHLRLIILEALTLKPLLLQPQTSHCSMYYNRRELHRRRRYPPRTS